MRDRTTPGRSELAGPHSTKVERYLFWYSGESLLEGKKGLQMNAHGISLPPFLTRSVISIYFRARLFGVPHHRVFGDTIDHTAKYKPWWRFPKI